VAAAQIVLIVLAAVALVLMVHAVMLYNGLVTVKNNVARAWANIDVLLKQRHDELPRLVEVCKAYRDFEHDTLVHLTEARTRVARAREAVDIAALGPAEAALRVGVARVFALAERYPELKANANFLRLQQRITELEDAIADRRELYNDSVNINNTRIEQFPEVLIARSFSFRERRLLEFAAAEKAGVDTGALLAQK
jgi:LemA protein